MKRGLFIFLLIPSSIYAQNNTAQTKNATWQDSVKAKTTFVSLNIGFSIPMLDYGNKHSKQGFLTNSNDSTQAKGYANTGLHLNASGGTFITPHFGLLVNLIYNLNTFNETSLGNGYIIHQNYSIWEYMGGVFGSFKTDKTTSVWVQAMAGTITANYPSFTINGIIYSSNRPFVTALTLNGSLANAQAFAYSAGIGCKKDISPYVSFLLMLNYTGAELSYPSFTYYNLTTGYPPYTQKTPITMSYGNIDISVGFLFHT